MLYRKQMLAAMRAAGVKPWPKLFQNLRSTRETELAELYPVQVVCQWIGNSPQVAARHYLQVTEDHFARATGAALQKAVQQSSKTACNADSPEGARPHSHTENQHCTPVHIKRVGPLGLEPRTGGL